MKKAIEVNPNQMAFLESTKAKTLFCGGLGSGKTHGGAVWAATMVLKYPRTKGLITANSYSQLKKATLPKFFQILEEFGLKYKYKSQDGVIEVAGSEVYAISMEKYDLLRGIEVGWAWSDECAFYREEAFDVLIGRIRDTRGPCHWKGTTTPNGFNWLYKKFVQSPLNNSCVIYGKTSDNLKNLGETYEDDLRMQYDARLARQELDGEFVNLNAGKVYHAFDRKLHCKPVARSFEPLFVGMDFNVDPMSGVIGFQRDGRLFISAELYERHSNTFKACKVLKERYPEEWLRIIPDSTGNKRQTTGEATDHEILRRAGFDVMPVRNPSQRDRYNNVNRLLDHGLLVIDPNCKWLIEDLEQLVHENKDELLSHISDALGYFCWYLAPLKKPVIPVSVSHY